MGSLSPLERDRQSLRFLESVTQQAQRELAQRTLVPDLFARVAATFPHRDFLVFEDRALTFDEVDALSNRLARWGRRQGLRPGDAVALLMANRPEYIVFWLAMTKIGVVSALVNAHLKADGLVYSIRTAEPKLVVVGAELLYKYSRIADQFDALACHVLGDGPVPWRPTREFAFARSLDEQLEHESDSALDRALLDGSSPLAPAFLMYTSGTTGMPKAAIVSHFTFYARSFAYTNGLDITEHDRFYCALPLYHASGGRLVVSFCFLTGAALCIGSRFSTSRFWDDVRKHECTMFQYIGEMARYLVNAPPRETDRQHKIRAVVGNGLRPDVWDTFQDRFGIPVIAEFYGATEGVLGFTNFCRELKDRGHLGWRGPLMKARLGAKIVQYDVENDVHRRDPTAGFLKECGLDEPGELLCELTPTRKFNGYYKNQEDSEKKVLRNVFVQGDAYFRTGDLFKIDSQHRWHFVDRVGDTFRWKGENVATNEVAEAIAKFPGLSDICVYGVQVPGNEGRACMAAMVFDESSFDLSAFAAHVRHRLPWYAMPLFLRQLGEMAVTSTLKYEKAKLRKEGMDPTQMSDRLWVYRSEKKTYERLTPHNFHALAVNSRL